MNNRKALLILALSVFIDFLCGSIVIPLLPFYGQKFGASASEITFVFSIQSLMALIASQFWGNLSDRLGRRPLLLVSLMGSSITCLWFGFLPNLWALFACMGLIGAFSGSAQVANAYIADTVPPAHRTQSIATLQAGFGIGVVVGPLLGGLLVGSASTDPNFSLPCSVAAILGLLAFGFAWVALPESLPQGLLRLSTISSSQSTDNQSSGVTGSVASSSSGSAQTSRFKLPFSFQDLGEVLQSSLTRVLLVGLFLTIFAVAGVQSILGLWASQELDWGPQNVSYLYAYWGIMGVLIQITLIGFLTRRFGEANLFIGGLLVYSVGLALIPFGYTLPLLLMTLTLACLGFSIARVVFFSLLSQSTSARRQGQVQGLASFSMSLAGIIAPLFSGYTFNTWGSSWPFWIGPILIVGSMTLSIPVINQSRLSLARIQQRNQALSQLFRMLDYDRNGVIEPQDFEQIVASIAELRGWPPTSLEYRTVSAFWLGLGETLQERVDTSGDHKITEMEWSEYMGKGLDIDFADAFTKLIDVDHDGRICLNELKTFYLAYKVDSDAVEQRFHDLDLDQDHYISSEEMKETFKHFMYGENFSTSATWLIGI